MKQIEKTISPLIDSLFPSFYQSEGENFVAFIRAYYEWLEQNFQLLTLEDNTGFVEDGRPVGDGRITQQNVTGTIYSVIDGDLLVKVDSNETFKCFNICSELIPVTKVNAGTTYSTYILRGGSARRLGSVFLSRNLLDYRDIDETIDLFVVFFKEKYLTNIEFDTATNKRLLVKNSLDLYRAKGTDRAIDLFFRLVYATKPQVEYPADVLFQPSGATWVVPKYLEISPNTVDRAITLVGKEITGVTSGAKAFVEKYVKLRINNGYSHVLFISNIKGNFTTRELIRSDQLYPDSPVIYGSLNQITISSSSSGFSIGDIFPVVTSTGIEGLARVTETRNATGQVQFELTEEGYGYALSNTSPSYLRPMAMISDNLVTVSNVVSGNIVSSIIVRSGGSGFSNGGIITIPSVNGDDAYAVIITNGSNAIIQADLAYPGSGFNVGTGTAVASGGTGGSIDYFTSAPAQYYNLFDDIKQTNTSGGVVASGLIIGDPLEATLTVVSPSASAIFAIGDRVYQQDTVSGEYASAVILRPSINTLGGTLRVNNIEGRFRTNQPIFVEASGSSATLTSVLFKFPVDVTSGAFEENTQFIISSEKAGFSGNTLTKSTGANAQFEVFDLDTNKETIYVNTDKLSNTTILNTPLDAIQFNLPQSPTSNVSFNIFGALTFEALQIGEVKTIAGITPGSNYNEDPFVLMYQPYVANMDKRNLKLSLTGEFTAFTINELITQVYSEPVYTVTIGSTSGLRVNEGIYVQNAGTNVAFGKVKSITNTTVFVMNDIQGPMQTGYTIKSYSNASFTETVSAFNSSSQDITVKSRLLEQSGNDLIIKPMNYVNDFIVGTKVVGESGANGTVILIHELDSNPMGYNADVFADAITADGEILTAQIVNSGFGYIDSQGGTTTLEDGRRINYLSSPGIPGINTGGLGTGSGSYRSLKGFLSDLSKLHDGDFYQEYSYNIISNISFDKYAEMFKKVLHTAGTRFFGSVLLSSVIEDTRIEAVPNTSIIVSDTSPFVIFAPELDTAPAPWGTTSGVPNTVRLDDEEVADFANVHIEIRN